ncbi:MAG: hypothetical protein ACRC6V_12300 [Bacteroidales bacterium]
MNLETLKTEMSKVEYVVNNTNYPCIRVRKVVRVSDLVLICSSDLSMKKEMDYQRNKMITEATRDAINIMNNTNYNKYTSSLVSLETIKDVDSRDNVVSELLVIEVGGSFE